jgi:hypothetical protein
MGAPAHQQIPSPSEGRVFHLSDFSLSSRDRPKRIRVDPNRCRAVRSRNLVAIETDANVKYGQSPDRLNLQNLPGTTPLGGWFVDFLGHVKTKFHRLPFPTVIESWFRLLRRKKLMRVKKW